MRLIGSMLIALAATAGCATHGSVPQHTFMVLCDCGTPPGREAVAKAIRANGGSIVYDHQSIPAFTIAGPGGAREDAFVATVRAIPGVLSVRRSGAAEIHPAR